MNKQEKEELLSELSIKFEECKKRIGFMATLDDIDKIFLSKTGFLLKVLSVKISQGNYALG